MESCREASAYMGSVWKNDLLYTFDGGCARIGSNMYLSSSNQFLTERVIDSCVENLPEVTKTYTDVSEGMLRITDPQECMIAAKAYCSSKKNFVEVQSGTCASNGYTNVESTEECTEANNMLRLNYAEVFEYNQDSGPTGCLHGYNSMLFNTNINTRQCGFVGWSCICKEIPTGACANQLGCSVFSWTSMHLGV